MSKRLGMFSLVAGIVFSLSALAGKPERDKIAELKPKVTEIEKNVKEACGCKIKTTVAWDSYKKEGDMWRIVDALQALETAAKAQCDNAENKKALCSNLTEVKVEFRADVGDLVLKGKVVTAGSNDSSYNGDHQFKAIFDKF